MSVLIKRSNKTNAIPNECPYGCCTTIYGKNTKRVRRNIKRRERNQWKKIVEHHKDVY